ncbi:hypothetical protein BCR43DRAFT_496994 [Syncephalastrum racemosum]|uniref:PH domain-containing protein n=1 Tax=Syncephalastrum racemosum TaxID=13706 RepID=A0A1X2H693_SYNRA|nr:hypothetical protein BCR43DRAFT_496994 [Syncephalastrum racemosum]
MPSSSLTHSSNTTRSSSSISRTPPSPTLDPWCMSIKAALEDAVCSDWLHKYDPPATFAFRAWKRRYFVIVDRIVYVFKSTKSTAPAREHFLITDDTLVFVTEEFKKGCVLELRKPLCTWYLRCDSTVQMKSWLEALKKIVACIKLGYAGPFSQSNLATLRLEDDFRLLSFNPAPPPPPTPRPSLSSSSSSSNHKPRHTSRANHRSAILRASLPPDMRGFQWTQPSPSHDRRSSTPQSTSVPRRPPFNGDHHSNNAKRQSLALLPDWEKSLPPQMPPPQSNPPPPPPASSSSSSSSSSAIQPPSSSPQQSPSINTHTAADEPVQRPVLGKPALSTVREDSGSVISTA